MPTRRMSVMSRDTEKAKLVLEDKTEDIVAVKEVLRGLMNQMDEIYEDLGVLYSLHAARK